MRVPVVAVCMMSTGAWLALCCIHWWTPHDEEDCTECQTSPLVDQTAAGCCLQKQHVVPRCQIIWLYFIIKGDSVGVLCSSYWPIKRQKNTNESRNRRHCFKIHDEENLDLLSNNPISSAASWMQLFQCVCVCNTYYNCRPHLMHEWTAHWSPLCSENDKMCFFSSSLFVTEESDKHGEISWI